MTLGERIHALRVGRGLSQGDVADALSVSRQSVSKWETDGSVPELDKLIALSTLFGVSLDELVRGEDVPSGAQPAPPAAPASSPASQAQPHETRKVIGVILLCFGALLFLLLTFLGDALTGLLFASPFLLCGAVCLLIRKHTGLWCTWAAFACFSAYVYFATGITWRLILSLPYYTASMNYACLAFAFLGVLLTLALVTATVCRFSKEPLPATRRAAVLLGAGWLVFLAMHFIHISFSGLPNIARRLSIFLLIDAPRCALLTVLLTFTVRMLRTCRAGRRA